MIYSLIIDSMLYEPTVEIVSSIICGQRRPRSDCVSAQSDRGFRCSLTESFDTAEFYGAY